MNHLTAYLPKLAGLSLITATCLMAASASASTGPAGMQTLSGNVCTHNPQGSLMVRNGPGRNSRALSSLKNGAVVLVLDKSTGSDGEVWYNIKHQRLGGWVRYDYVCNVS